jgi:hypothetical protein
VTWMQKAVPVHQGLRKDAHEVVRIEVADALAKTAQKLIQGLIQALSQYHVSAGLGSSGTLWFASYVVHPCK